MRLKNYDFKTVLIIIKGWFTNNKRYKLSALIIAVILWTTVTIDSKSKVTMDVPLQISLSSETNMVIVGDIVKEVSLTVWGPNEIVRTLGPSQIKVYLDIKDPVKGENIFALTSKNIFLPNKVVFLNINPKTVRLNFQKLK